MTFLHPEFLWGLLALAIPIAIHLFHFRKFKRIEFTNVKFLKEVKKDKESKRKLKHYLVLLSRLLAITFLVIAFAMPIKGGKGNTNDVKQKYVSIYLDNSLSMRAYGKDGILHETSKNLARKIVEGFSPSDRFQILSNELTGSEMRYVDQEAAINRIDELEVSSSSKRLQQIIELQKNNFSNNRNGVLNRFIISDFQKSIANISIPDDTIKTYLVPLNLAHQENLGIDSCWFKSPVMNVGSEVILVARLHNYGNEAIEEASVNLKINGMTKGSGTVNIPSRGFSDVELSFKLDKKGINEGQLGLIGDERLFDDIRYFSFNVNDKSKVMIVNSGIENEFLSRVFGDNPEIELNQFGEGSLDYSKIQKQDLLILNSTSLNSSAFLDEVYTFVNKGGNLLVIPGLDISSQNSILTKLNVSLLGALHSEKVNFGDVKARHPFYEGVVEKRRKQNYTSGVKRYYSLNVSEGDKLITLNNGRTFAAISSHGTGNVITLTSPLISEWSDFPKFSFFVPFMLRAAVYGKENSRLYGIVGEKEFVKINSFSENQLLVSYNGVELIPESKLTNNGVYINASEEITLAGNYPVKSKSDGILVHSLSYNYSKDESETLTISAEELEENIPNNDFWKVLDSNSSEFEAKLLSQTGNQSFWRIFILMVLLFLAIEIILIKFVKV